MNRETPTEKYLREILELLKLKASQPIFPPYVQSSCQHQWTKSCCSNGSGHTGAGGCQYRCGICGAIRSW